MLRETFSGTLIVAGNYDLQKAEKILAAGYADLIAFGRPFIANPDLPHRLAHQLPLAQSATPLRCLAAPRRDIPITPFTTSRRKRYDP